jgi:hypothetical protein
VHYIEVDQKAQMLLAQFEIRQQLSLMDGRDGVNGLIFNHD